MQLRDIEYVVTIAECGSFSKAAEKLYISQPALSQSIKRLETELGVSLFARKRGSIVLTHPGIHFLADARQIMQLSGHIRKQMSVFQGVEQGELNIGFTPLFGRYYFAEAYRRFHNEHPGIEVNAFENRSDILEEMIASGGIDLALLPLPMLNQDLSCETILSEETFLAVPASHPINGLVKKEPDGFGRINMEYFKDDDFILLHSGQRLRKLGMEACRAAGFEPHIAFETGYVDTANALVSAGVGVSFIPYMIFSTRNNNGGNEYYHINGINAERIMVAAYDKSVPLSPAATAFMETMKKLYN